MTLLEFDTFAEEEETEEKEEEEKIGNWREESLRYATERIFYFRKDLMIDAKMNECTRQETDDQNICMLLA